MDIQKLAEETGCDLQAAVARLGGMTALYERLLKKFLTDPTFQELQTAVEQGDEKGMELHAHTLKGLAANLGFTTLSTISNEIVSAVRQGEPEKAQDLFPECGTQYRKIYQAVAAEVG